MTAERDLLITKIAKINVWTQMAERGDLEWGTACDKAFDGLSVVNLLAYQGIALDYCDPDTSYEDDLKANNNALQDVLYKELVK